ncbi:MAG: hypothetical protein A3J62_02785 [Candidatus Buchananbacteria bacterium RIFCSPHIGHO2_02_FULL_38_8]|uniref:Uncharacterized protein n=2 Tax=Candidatus Buchananiibacteriota TaxID=1817903 RepID=A0A1G1Y2R4_9BACT|nr:hypothetical protein [uncultured bacterium]OGY45857.1 MAG: hypothetical protein A2731_01915 [Candidatus Buchananbacteria bacterium RIFCSPHIGHO2_01_FULL_39_8]OGY47516.1 MAG: hypothetical protein A3J62_02785 [Candidatus Buchananbacteria bacterium RIFCSPHIGHO2_02_FULL_38_8]
MPINKGLERVKDLFDKPRGKKPPAYPWQDLALRVIEELNVPPKKRNSVFKVCKGNSKITIEKTLNDTKELCKTGEKWKYFFKIIENK